MGGVASEQGSELQTLVFGVPIGEEQVARLSAEFPDLKIVVAPFEALQAAIPEADAVVAWELSADEVAAAGRLKWFQSFAAGVESVLFPELIARDIPITNASGVHAPNIAEHLMAMMLAFARGLPQLIRGQERREWLDDPVRGIVNELNGQTLLVVGTGDIGCALAERSRVFGVTPVGVRRRPDLPVAPCFDAVHGVEALPDLLPEADQVAICLPLTARTRGLFDRAILARMKPTAYLYNIGRGPIVETAALVELLRERRLAGAGLDVTDPEPLPPDSPLWAMENVLITAHTSGATPRYWDRVMEILVANIGRFQRGEPLLNRVDVREGY
jgi:phosphoglycerate dehydrogenase-like enzyme